MKDNLRTDNDIISEIIKLQIGVSNAVFKGHKANDDDEYAEDRKRLVILRQILTDRKSNSLKINNMTAEERVKQDFESLKGQFVITQSHKIERLVAIGEDEHDLYWVTYDGRKLTWNTCVGRVMPLKGYLRDEDYNELVRSATLNDFDQETCWKDNGEKSEQHKLEIVESINERDKLLSDLCWDLN